MKAGSRSPVDPLAAKIIETKLHSHGHSAGQQNRKFEKRRPGWAHGNGNQAGVSVLTRSLGETMPHRAPCSDTISWLAPVRPSILMAS